MDYILTHHGVKGQKWGVRRYQNPDGSLTNAGKRRRSKYIGDDGYYTRRGKNRALSDDIRNLKSSQDVYRVASNKRREVFNKQNAVWNELKNATDDRRRNELLKQDAKYDMDYRIIEGGRKSVSKAFDVYHDSFLKSMDDPSIKQTQKYKDAKDIVKQYRKAKIKDLVTSGGKQTTNRLKVVTEEGRKHPARNVW